MEKVDLKSYFGRKQYIGIMTTLILGSMVVGTYLGKKISDYHFNNNINKEAMQPAQEIVDSLKNLEKKIYAYTNEEFLTNDEEDFFQDAKKTLNEYGKINNFDQAINPYFRENRSSFTDSKATPNDIIYEFVYNKKPIVGTDFKRVSNLKTKILDDFLKKHDMGKYKANITQDPLIPFIEYSKEHIGEPDFSDKFLKIKNEHLKNLGIDGTKYPVHFTHTPSGYVTNKEEIRALYKAAPNKMTKGLKNFYNQNKIPHKQQYNK